MTKEASGPDPEIARLERVYSGYRADDRYRARWAPTATGNRAIDAERWEVARDALGRASRWPPRGAVLEVGCGTGQVLARFSTYVEDGRLIGVDVLEDRLAEAAKRPEHLRWVRADGRALPAPDGAFGFVIAFTVFSSVLDRRSAVGLAREIDRVLEPGGAVVWYDFRVSDPRNRNTRGMSRRRVGSLFPDYLVDLRTTTLVPQVARRLHSSRVYRALSSIPVLRTHYCGVLVKPSDGVAAAS